MSHCHALCGAPMYAGVTPTAPSTLVPLFLKQQHLQQKQQHMHKEIKRTNNKTTTRMIKVMMFIPTGAGCVFYKHQGKQTQDSRHQKRRVHGHARDAAAAAASPAAGGAAQHKLTGRSISRLRIWKLV